MARQTITPVLAHANLRAETHPGVQKRKTNCHQKCHHATRPYAEVPPRNPAMRNQAIWCAYTITSVLAIVIYFDLSYPKKSP